MIVEAGNIFPVESDEVVYKPELKVAKGLQADIFVPLEDFFPEEGNFFPKGVVASNVFLGILVVKFFEKGFFGGKVELGVVA